MSAAFDRVVAALGDRVKTWQDGQVTAHGPGPMRLRKLGDRRVLGIEAAA